MRVVTVWSSIVPTIALAPFTRLVLSDLRGPKAEIVEHAEHLGAALDWLIRAHDHGDRGGVSYGYSVRGGWRPPYVETTGYIATTFFELAHRLDRPDLRDRAIQMVDWLVEVQLADGSFGNDRMTAGQGIVFDTGQDLFGLVRASIETGDERFHDAARRAGDWLVDVADAGRRWTRNTHLGVPHVYNSRVAWALLQLNQVAPSADYEGVARANLDWAVSEQRSSGLYDNCAFEQGHAPFTHTIAYAIRGLWESGEILDDDDYRTSARRAADAMLPHVGADGCIPGQIDVDGHPAARYCCLTGNAQLAIVWAKMWKRSEDERYRRAASSALGYVMARQDRTTRDDGRRGAIKGSHPTWGRYSRLTYPNWAAKFFIDAVVECRDLQPEIDNGVDS